jgi:hypothetical protein
LFLCREFTSRKPRTDAEWKAMLDTGNALAGPGWRVRIEVKP